MLEVGINELVQFGLRRQIDVTTNAYVCAVYLNPGSNICDLTSDAE